LLHILHGEDDFTLREALVEIKKGLGDDEMLATNTTVFEGQNLSPEQLGAACDTMPFLAPNRLIVVEGLLSRFEKREKGKRSSKKDDSGWLSFKDRVPRMPETTVLVLIDGPLKKGNPLLRQLAPHAVAREYVPPRGTQLHEWIRSRVDMCGSTASLAAVRLLADLAGGNLRLLSHEIEKLCAYAHGRNVDENDVRALVADAREANVFAMIDAILERKSALAVRLLHDLENDGAAPPFLLFMITRQFRTVIQAKDLLLQKRKHSEMGASLGIASDYALRKTLEQARGHSMQRLDWIYRRLLDTDISIKTGRLKGDKGELALDLLITELCAGTTGEGPGP
jgi:DNA polymerase-3 subunit delta